MTTEILIDLRKLLKKNPNLVTWRTVWRAHIQFALMLRWDDISRLTTSDLVADIQNGNRIYRMNLHGGKTVMSGAPRKPERILTSNDKDPEACLVRLTER